MAEQQYQNQNQQYQPKAIDLMDQASSGLSGPQGIEDILGDISDAVEKSNLSQNYKQSGGQ